MSNPPDTFSGTITLPALVWERIEHWADATDLGRNGLVEVAVEAFLCAMEKGAAEDAAWLRRWFR